MATFYGADVSEFQGTIDWQAFNPGAAFVWIKGSGGDGVEHPLYIDAQLANNKTGVRALGNAMPHGFYHFAGARDPIAEANYFVDNVCSDLQVGEAVALDWEKELPDPVGWCKQWKDQVENRLGFPIVFYIDTDRLKRYDFSSILSTSALWEANYGVTPDQNISGSPVYTFHQYRNDGSFPGIKGNVDVDAFFAEHITDFFKLGKPASVVVAPPVLQPVTTPPVVPQVPQTPAESPQPPVDTQPELGTVVQPEQPPKPPMNGTAIDVVVNPPKPKPQPVEQVPQSTKVVVSKTSEVTKIEGFIMKLGRYNKFWIGLTGAILTYLSLHYGSSTVVQDAVLIASVAGIYAIPNVPSEPAK